MIVTGKLNSLQHNQSLNVQDAKLQLFKERDNPDKLKLSINGMGINDWLRQKYQELKSARPHIRPAPKSEANNYKYFKRYYRTVFFKYYLGKTGSKYVEYDPNCLLDDANTIKARIALRNSDVSENGIKAKLIFDPDAKYIDSEFAYPEIIGKKKDRNGKEIAAYQTTRID